MSKCLIDYTSFTWSPEPLIRITQLAKMGARLKSIPAFAQDFNPKWNQWHQVNTPRTYAQADESIPARKCFTANEYQEYRDQLFSYVQTVRESASMATGLDVARELKAMLTDSLNEDEFIIDTADFHASYSDIVITYGVQLLDAVCHAEIDLLVMCLNHHMSGHQAFNFTGPHFGRWSYRLRRGGMFGYSCSADLLCDGEAAGICAWGAMNHGCLVSFSGSGCAALDFVQLHHVLNKLPGCKLTRVDVALDDYTGEHFDLDRFRDWALEGAFTKRRPPRYQYFESGHLLPLPVSRDLVRQYGFVPVDGRSFYLGSRDSGLMFRSYEKGKQLKSAEFPNWQRAEVEIRNVDRVIPFDVLINPDVYFAGSYPCLAKLVQAIPEPIKTNKGKVWSVFTQAWIEKAKASRARVVETAATQCGRVVNFLRHVEARSSDEIVQLLSGHLEPADWPLRMKAPMPLEFVQDEYQKTDLEHRYGGMVII